LFDEIEKAHRDVWNILLQILVEGELTDSHGRTVNFRNTIIIMTSNIGSHELAQQAKMGFSLPEESDVRDAAAAKYEELKDTVMRELQEHMAPELLARIDQVIVFAPLTIESLEKIVDIHIKELVQIIKQKQVNLEVSKGVRQEIASRAFAQGRGARPIRRVIQEILEDPIAHSMINKDVHEGQTIQARKTGKKITVEPFSEKESSRS
ncbi:MAG: AAA family ATPase, partial [Acidobacteriota bacterium]